MENQKITSKQYFKTLSIIYYVLITGIILLMAVALIFRNDFESLRLNQRIQFLIAIIIPALIVVGFFSSKSLFKRQLNKISMENDLILKMQNYQKAWIIKYVILDTCAFISILSVIFTGNTMFLIFSLLVVLLFFIDRPSPIRAARELELHSDDAQRLQNPDEIIA